VLSLLEQQQVITNCAKDPFYFGKVVAPQYFPNEFAPFHRHMIEEINNLPKHFKMVILEVPRGFGKTLIVSTLNPLHRAIFGGRGDNKLKYLVIASYSSGKAEQIINDYKVIIKGNNFQGIFPGTVLLKDREDLIEVENKDMGFRFQVMGRGRSSQIAGLRFEEARPQIFIGDDLEDPDESYNQMIVDKNERFVNGVVQYGLDRERGFSILIGTPFAFDCTTQRFSRYPKGVKTIRYPGMVSDTVDMSAAEMSEKLGVPVGHSIWEHGPDTSTEELKKQMDAAIQNGTLEHFMRQVMLDPRPEGALGIPTKRITYIEKDKLDELKKMKMNVYILADYAYSRHIWADESAYVIVGIDDSFNHYILESDAGKWGDIGTTDRIIKKAYEYRDNLKMLGVESRGVGFIEKRVMDMKREKGLSFAFEELKPFKNKSKPERIKGTISLFDDGLVFMVRGQSKLLSQMERFRGEDMLHGDDILDAFAYIRQVAIKPVTQKTLEEKGKEQNHLIFERWAKSQPAYIREQNAGLRNRRVYHAGMRPNYF